jgi:hypothetical protein
MADPGQVIVERNPEAEYDDLVRQLQERFPDADMKGYDYSRIAGSPDKRAAKAIVLYLVTHGMSLHEIADQLDIEPGTVARYVGQAVREAVSPEVLETWRSFETMKIEAVEKLLWEEIHNAKAEGCEMEPDEAAHIRIQCSKVLLEASKHRRTLHGWDSPAKKEITKQEQRLEITEIVVRTPEDVASLRAAGLLK